MKQRGFSERDGPVIPRMSVPPFRDIRAARSQSWSNSIPHHASIHIREIVFAPFVALQLQLRGQRVTASAVVRYALQAFENYGLMIPGEMQRIVRIALSRLKRWQSTNYLPDRNDGARSDGRIKCLYTIRIADGNHYAPFPALGNFTIGGIQSLRFRESVAEFRQIAPEILQGAGYGNTGDVLEKYNLRCELFDEFEAFKNEGGPFIIGCSLPVLTAEWLAWGADNQEVKPSAENNF